MGGLVVVSGPCFVQRSCHVAQEVVVTSSTNSERESMTQERNTPVSLSFRDGWRHELVVGG